MKHHATVEEKWAANTKPAEDGHLLWTGAIHAHGGTPVIDLRGKRYQAARVAFQIHHGREPHGVVRVSCGVALCVAGAHIRDTADRQGQRAFQRALDGRDLRTGTCIAGHDQATHGRIRADGRPYCNACNQTYRNTRKTSTAA